MPLQRSSSRYLNVPKYGVVDAQVNHKISSMKTVVKIGGTNIGGGDYRTNLGSPSLDRIFASRLRLMSSRNNR